MPYADKEKRREYNREYQRGWRERNKEKVRGYQQAGYERDPERRKEQWRASYHKHKDDPGVREKLRERALQYYYENTEACKATRYEYYAKNRETILERFKETRWLTKAECVEYLGGCCSCCGFDEHIVALQFHHREPDEKLFCIGEMLSAGWSFDRLKDELDKCVLVCANCHWIIGLEEHTKKTGPKPKKEQCTPHKEAHSKERT